MEILFLSFSHFSRSGPMGRRWEDMIAEDGPVQRTHVLSMRVYEHAPPSIVIVITVIVIVRGSGGVVPRRGIVVSITVTAVGTVRKPPNTPPAYGHGAASEAASEATSGAAAARARGYVKIIFRQRGSREFTDSKKRL